MSAHGVGVALARGLMRKLLIDAIGLIAPDIAPQYRVRLALFCLLWLAVVIAIVAWLLLRP